jgi:hypothetical protein
MKTGEKENKRVYSQEIDRERERESRIRIGGERV